MFVTNNTIAAARTYFYSFIAPAFSASESKAMFDTLLQKRLNWTKTELMLQSDGRLSESDLLYVRNVAHRLKENEPFQYIIGETYFYGLTINCDSRVLIPRPETEELVAWLLDDNSPVITSILDIGTGSGCIALACKSVLTTCQVTAVDCSKEALDLAQLNAEKLALDISFIEWDVLSNAEGLLDKGFKYDRIISNPPYIPLRESASMEINVLNFEPELALFVPNDNPLLFYKRIMEISLLLLNGNGYLYLEIHENFALEISSLLKENGFINIELRKDLQGKPRMIKAKNATFIV